MDTDIYIHINSQKPNYAMQLILFSIQSSKFAVGFSNASRDT